MFPAPPQPYSFGYDNVDEFGNRQFRSEQGDSSNTKTGSYGYRDANGLYRRVNYVADAYGFRATVDTNEPGTAPGASADAVFNAAPMVPPVPSGNVQGGTPAGFATRLAAPYNAGGYSGYGSYGYNPYASASGAYGYTSNGRQGYAAGAPALGGFAYGGQSLYGYGASGYGAGYAPGLYEPPQPYSFGYDNVDEYGNRQFRSEQGDSNNAKTGSYGYRDANGLYRRVNYVADAYGFRATVDTNEPGTAPGASADAVFNAAPVVPPVPSGNVQGGARAGFAARVAAPYNGGGYGVYGRYGYNPYASVAGAYGYPPYGRQGYAATAPGLGGFAYGGQSSYGYGVAGYGAGYAPGPYGVSAGYESWPSAHRGFRRR
ncbi:hypothetical protein HPB52_001557 [Rhipicephalus sanguineus]|uniref:Cuticle protein n=1 Tax=Rhipicephalus sanguineus TaxID=34632 RepID=A0A9D4SZH9_RHISA|nr:hypothetical protein HPB52_001557 [Rhipicephalus sanguineus]